MSDPTIREVIKGIYEANLSICPATARYLQLGEICSHTASERRSYMQAILRGEPDHVHEIADK